MRALTAIILTTLVAAGCDPPEIQIRETPIKVMTEKKGHGPPVRVGDEVRIQYSVTTPDGKVVVADEDFRFNAGAGTVIRGIDEAIIGMREGGVRKFTCPPHHHWGRAGYGNGAVPPATDLTVILHLNRIEGRTVMRRGESTGS